MTMLALFLPVAGTIQAAQNPNIVYILCDDLGYGDVQCLNPERGKIATPHMDQLAAQGMTFTDAHTSSSVCTPSRYGILTGRYNWRTQLQTSVLWGYSEPLIASDRLTVAGLLKQQGYNTACIGKWHLGMTMPTTNGILPKGRKPKRLNIVWDGVIQNGPTACGFDYYYGIAASLDMAPYIFIENDRFDGEIPADGKSDHAKGFDRSDVLPKIGRKTIEYIEQQKASKPFFIYVPLTSPHTPIVPTAEWQGKSGLGTYGDFVMQTDDVIGKIVAAIDQAGLSDNTIVVVTSDNGCSKAAGGRQGLAVLEKQGHYPSAQFRGSKADIWDGGHRVPFFVRWPAKVKAQSTSDQTICLTDLMATAAELSGAKLPSTAGEDSVSFLPALSDQPIISTRSGVIHHSIDGYFAYRQGKWKLCLAKGSGGWTSPKEKEVPASSPVAQLYDMEADPGETTNLYASQPEVAQLLLKQLEADIEHGRSTAGPEEKNDFKPIKLWKNGK
jgi:arylsulfatase A-like enzyme